MENAAKNNVGWLKVMFEVKYVSYTLVAKISFLPSRI
jgi:hypothetical protein